MKLLIETSELQRFKRKASKSYPKEIFGILLGTEIYDKRKQTFRIDKIAIPAVKVSTYDYVIPDYAEIDKIINETQLYYIGSIHSHPQAAPTVSEHDFHYWDRNEIVMGILSVRKRSMYKTTELKFWRKQVALPIKFKIFVKEKE